MTQWIIEKSVGFTDVGLLRIAESVRAYTYLILSPQASARSSIVGNMASSLTAQSAFLNNFENFVNRRVDIREDLKRYQDTLYKILISDGNFSLGKNDEVNEMPKISHQSTITRHELPRNQIYLKHKNQLRGAGPLRHLSLIMS